MANEDDPERGLGIGQVRASCLAILLLALSPAAAGAAETIRLTPAMDVEAAIEAAPPGTRFVFADGLYRGFSVQPKDRQVFEAEGGAAILDGSIVIGGWERFGDVWIAKIPPAQWNHGEARDGFPALQREDLFIDEELLIPVMTAPAVAPGRWFRDREQAIVADDPTGKLMELGYEAHAFSGAAEGVVIQGLTVRQYASPAQRGAIEANEGRAWQILDVTAEYNHSRGLSVNDDMVVRGGHFLWNGQLGLAGIGHRLLVEGAELAYNNWAGHRATWESGGIKLTKSDGVVIRRNVIHRNVGPGIWLDWDNRDALIEGNLVYRNATLGIQIEASRGGVIRDNFIVRNDTVGYDVAFWGSDLLIQNSSGYTITGNTIVVAFNKGLMVTQQDRGSGQFGQYGEHLATDNRVSGNTIIYPDGVGQSGAWADHKPGLVYDTTLFFENRYIVPAGEENRAWWQWLGRNMTIDEVQASGLETGSTIIGLDDPSAEEPDYGFLAELPEPIGMHAP